VAYWIVGGILALFNLYGGGLKVLRDRERLLPLMEWVESMPMRAVRGIGAIEVLGALGLILPPLTGIARWLAFAAAIGFVLLQIAATRVHLSRGDRQIGLNLGLILVAGAAAGLATVWL
jgi:hypothetical protein